MLQCSQKDKRPKMYILSQVLNELLAFWVFLKYHA